MAALEQETAELAPDVAGDGGAAAACETIRNHSRYARLPVHAGTATLVADGEPVTGSAEFLLPADGAPIIAIRASRELTNNLAEDLQIVGLQGSQPFTLTSSVCYTRRPECGRAEGWSLVSPMNGPVRIEYSGTESVTTARLVLTNFDYECGDAVVSSNGFTRIGTPMVVQLADRRAVFARREDYDSVYPLVCAGLLRSASLTECSIELSGDTDEELLILANDIASLLTVAHGGSVGVAIAEFLDSHGRPARRIVREPVRSRYRHDPVVKDFYLPRLFQESFETHVKMHRSTLPWRKLPSYCGSLDDLPYIEQKFAALMMALEFFMRVSLIEDGEVEADVAKFEWNQLIGVTRRRLGWDIPKHYTARDTPRLLRNAVMHGAEAPVKDSTEFRLLFNKWRLFLFRRILIRLGYKGEVISPWRGVAESSAVDDFSEEHNSFDQSETETHPFVQFVRYVKERSKDKAEAETTAGN